MNECKHESAVILADLPNGDKLEHCTWGCGHYYGKVNGREFSNLTIHQVGKCRDCEGGFWLTGVGTFGFAHIGTEDNCIPF